eukprot:4235851-Prymnesium_polylepis.1
MLLSDGVSGTDNERPTLYVAGGRASVLGLAVNSCYTAMKSYPNYWYAPPVVNRAQQSLQT